MMTISESSSKMPPREVTPRDDVKKVVSEVLKRVDNFIRRGELEQAEHCVIQARELDPKNIYAYAFQERISILKEQAHQNTLAAAVCKAPESKKQDEEHKRTNAVQPQKEPQKPEMKSQPSPRVVVQKIPSISAQSCVESKPRVPITTKTEPAPTPPKEQPKTRPVPVATPQASGQQHAMAEKKLEEDRNLKIQRMIKIAVDSVRQDIELKQLEIRERERGEFERREQVRIKEAAEAARKAEEERQIELRRKSDDQLQQKIREALQRKRAPDMFEVDGQPPAEASSAHRRPDDQTSPLTQVAYPVSAERQETLERYRLVLSSVWADGAVSEEETLTLKQLRESLSISSEEHARLEKEVQRETYIEAFKKAWHSGTITPENTSVLAELRQRFQISNEEHLTIESRILWEIQPVKDRPTLLVVDDDERLLKVVSKTLNEAGFITTPVTTSDEAYAYLKESSPDLILCDVNLETSTMGGFAFYEKVREFERLRDTPFIFLSGLTDEALVRTGKELGVDDYLSKPVSEETLVATIKGKLRRYHELKKQMN